MIWLPVKFAVLSNIFTGSLSPRSMTIENQSKYLNIVLVFQNYWKIVADVQTHLISKLQHEHHIKESWNMWLIIIPSMDQWNTDDWVTSPRSFGVIHFQNTTCTKQSLVKSSTERGGKLIPQDIIGTTLPRQAINQIYCSKHLACTCSGIW